MNSPGLKIAVPKVFAAELERELAIPHSLAIISDQSDAEIARLLSATDVLVSGAFTRAWRDPLGCALRLVHSSGAGTDGIDFASLPPGCTVCNVYGHERGVAEQAFMVMLALQRNLFGLDRALRQGDWTQDRPYVPELRGRNLLILGLGHIGQELVRWGQFFGMNPTALTRSHSPQRSEKLGLHASGGLGELGGQLKEADFVVVAIPATAGTTDLIGEAEFALMKPTAFIVNVGRAAVINEAALFRALQTRRIAGAGLDVWYQYPAAGQKLLPGRLPFQELDNVIMTPHKPTIETMAYRWKKIADNLHRFARGDALDNVVAVV